jgi:thiamine transporter ThiT
MSEHQMSGKKGKNFKDIIAEEKTKGATRKKVMRFLTHINAGVLYCGSFLVAFVVLDALIYALFSPDVYIWAVALILTAVVSSIVASRLTNNLKKQQWKYAPA